MSFEEASDMTLIAHQNAIPSECVVVASATFNGESWLFHG